MKKRQITAFLLCLVLLLSGCSMGGEVVPTDTKPTDPPGESFRAKVLEVYTNSVLVEPLEGEAVRSSADQITFGTKELEALSVKQGDIVKVFYEGEIMESYPAQLRATAWEQLKDLRFMAFTEEWVDKETAEKYDNNLFDHIIITRIYENCFFAVTVIPMPNEIKLNGKLGEDWCVGDQVECTYENTYYDPVNYKIECDMLTIKESSWQPDPNACYKPVIYLYPEEETAVSVALDLSGELTCTYPAYQNGWQVTATPDGRLTDSRGQTYNYLYWEGTTDARWDMTKGFCVKGADTAAFLEEALEKLGLNRKEANEFIVYWLPLMEGNPYNIIAFQTEVYEAAAKLQVMPAPDTTIRVFMTWQASGKPVAITPQKLTAPAREGFTVVEWGGTEVK